MATHPSAPDESLDPSDWPAFRLQAHQMLDDALNYVEHIRERPVWRPIPPAARQHFHQPLPHSPTSLAAVHEEFQNHILPYATGNPHPGFMGWVHGGGTPVGMLADMLAASLNANLGGRDHVPIEVERQIVSWMQSLFGFPESATGLFVTGTSMANLIGILVARDVALGFASRCSGVAASPLRLTAYASEAAHSCIARALDFAGIGSDALRLIPAPPGCGLDLAQLEATLEADRRAGFTPFLLVGTAGSVDTGAIDNLSALADIAKRERLWFHIDGACGGLGMLAPDIAPLLRGIETADSLAFDFHKWGQVPYDAGFILVRDGVLHRQTFASSAAYLRREQTGLAGGPPWPCDFGPDLSRGFRALKTWFTFKVYGADALGAVISHTCELARYLAGLVEAMPELELLAPVPLNIVCFRYRVSGDSRRLNAQIVSQLQQAGAVAPSTTVIDNRLAIRAAIVNHRTSRKEIDTLVEQVLQTGRAMTETAQRSRQEEPSHTEHRAARQQREIRLKAIDAQLAKHFVAGGPAAEHPAAQHPAAQRAVAERPAAEHPAAKHPAAEHPAAQPAAERPTAQPAAEHPVAVPPAAQLPNPVPLHFERACLLDELGRIAEARQAYLHLLALDSSHRLALNNLGALLHQTGYRSAAQTAYTQAVAKHPEDAMSRVNLANVLREGGHLEEAREHYHAALRSDPCHAEAHQGLAGILSASGDHAAAAHHRRAGFGARPVVALPFRGEATPIAVLLLAAAEGGNVPMRHFLDDRIFKTYIVFVEFYDMATPLPPHSLVFNAIGDADLAPDALAAAQQLLALTSAPVINHPSAVTPTGRSDNAHRLADIAGVITPRAATLLRELLAGSGAAATLGQHGFEFPLLIRTPGFHTGLHFLRVENAAALPSALAEIPGPLLTVLQYLDARGADGKARKYRVMMIDGQLYPLHLAVSSHWKIHYFTAEMADNPEHRAQDAEFLADMPRVLGPQAMQALAAIQLRLGLDYAGVDFGLGPAGEVLFFEANATMVVNPPGSG